MRRLTSIILFINTLSVFGQNIDQSFIVGQWFQCDYDGEYTEYNFDKNTFVCQIDDSNRHSGIYEITSDTIKFKLDKSYRWEYALIIKSALSDSFIATYLDFGWPEMTYDVEVTKVPEKYKMSDFVNRESVLICLDKRTEEEIISDSISRANDDVKILELIDVLDSLKRN